MNKQFDKLMYDAGMTAQGCWDELDSYQRGAIAKFAVLIVQECASVVENLSPGYKDYRNQIEDAFRRDCVTDIKHHFGVEE